MELLEEYIMARTIQIGDIHGRSEWKNIMKAEKDADRYIFIGDYWDSFDVSYEEQEANWQDLMAKKEELGDRMIMLIGNHDFHYFGFAQAAGEKYSGFQANKSKLIQYDLEEALGKGYLQAAHAEGNILFTHAGVTQTWLNESGLVDSATLVAAMNALFETNPMRYGFLGLYDASGDEICQSPLWVRPLSLLADGLPTWTHVVGHTRVREIANKNNVWLTDVLENDKKQYLSIVDGEIKIETY